jgi:hypothetical protein
LLGDASAGIARAAIRRVENSAGRWLTTAPEFIQYKRDKEKPYIPVGEVRTEM